MVIHYDQERNIVCEGKLEMQLRNGKLLCSKILMINLPYFSIDNAHLMYKAHPKHFRHFFWCIDNARDAN
jgi:hypothetical protein